MKENMVRLLVLWRILLAIAVLVLCAYIVNYHFPFSGMKTIETDFRAGKGIVSYLYPVARVRDMAVTDGRSYRPMVEDPVYFDVRTIVPHERVRIILIYNNTTGVPLKIGMKLPEGTGADFELHALENEVKEGEWTRGEVLFDLSRASYYNSKYTFAFSVPGLRTEGVGAGEVRLAQMTLTLERDPIQWDDIILLWKKR